MKSEYDFEENNKKYTLETFFQIDIILEKTCYFKGEMIKGKIKIVPKDVVKKSYLLSNIIGNAILQEYYNYRVTPRGKDISEENILFKYPTDIPKFDGNKIIEGTEMAFEYPVPKDAYPSVIIDNNCYVRHILIFDFPSIEAKKSTLIIVKNDQYFSVLNNLYKEPAEAIITTGKHKFAIFYKGEVKSKMKLFKNTFAYNESIPFTLEIDCSNLTINITKVHISILLNIRMNNKSDHKIPILKTEKLILEKSISLNEDQKHFNIEDIIQLPDKNPGDIYKKLDSDNNKYSKKFNNVYLYPSCYNGLISCEYYIKMMLETDTLFSTNEFVTIQVDFYEEDKNEYKNKDENKNETKTLDEVLMSVMTPMGNKIQKPLRHSNTSKKEEKKEVQYKQSKTNDFLHEKNNENKINLNSDSNKINNDFQTDKNETNNEFDAPPSVINSSKDTK